MNLRFWIVDIMPNCNWKLHQLGLVIGRKVLRRRISRKRAQSKRRETGKKWSIENEIGVKCEKRVSILRTNDICAGCLLLEVLCWVCYRNIILGEEVNGKGRWSNCNLVIWISTSNNLSLTIFERRPEPRDQGRKNRNIPHLPGSFVHEWDIDDSGFRTNNLKRIRQPIRHRMTSASCDCCGTWSRVSYPLHLLLDLQQHSDLVWKLLCNSLCDCCGDLDLD